jgi:Zn-dependent protease with chaperone function
MSQSAEQSDLERQGVVDSSHPADNYGTTSQTAGKELPLLFGHFRISPGSLINFLVCFFVGVFAVHMIADIVYYATIDARFPAGLGHLYPSEEERHASVSYTRQMLAVSMLRQTVMFCVVVTLIYYQVFAKADEWVHGTASWLSSKWKNDWSQSGFGRFVHDVCVRTYEIIAYFVNMLICTCCEPCCETLRRWTANHHWWELFLGSIYLCIFAACLFLINSPFQYWMLTIDLNFGFANALSISTTGYEQKVFWEFLSILVMGIPGKFIFLAILQFRFGWLFMWSMMVMGLLFVQFNMNTLAPMILDMRNVFPYDVFGVGRSFPLVSTTVEKTTSLAPWISLNRIFFKDSGTVFSTRDKSKGPLQLALDSTQNSWTIAAAYYGTVYARTNAGGNTLESLDSQPWRLNGDTGYIGHRSGKDLRDKVLGFAKERDIHIAQIYMVDGSHKDARANAFVGGFNNSVIGLYDTLFLGDHASDAPDYAALNSVQQFLTLSDGGSALQAFMRITQDVNFGEANKHPELWSSAPTRAMTDDEIIAILAHELAHPALNHLVEQTFTHVGTLLATFAALGWAAHSPLLAVGLSLSAPVLHVGVCAYDMFIGPPLHSVMKFGGDFLVRHNEYEADAWVAKVSEKYGTALQTALAKLAVNTNQDPDIPYWYEMLYTDHPSAAHRWAHIENVKRQKYGK